METTVRYDTARFDRALEGYVYDLGAEAPKIVRFQARMFLQLLMRLLPPRSLAQGRAAVARDINYVVTGKNASWLLYLQQEYGNPIEHRVLRNKHGVPYVIDHAILDPDGSEIEGFHFRSRDRRGRIRVFQTQGRNSVDIGRHVSRDEVWAPYSEIRRYVEMRQRNVGRLKGGLWPALQRAGGRAPSWVTRHGGRDGDVVDLLSDKKHPRIRIINEAKGLESVPPRVIETALRSRIRAMEKDIRRIMAGGKSRHFS